MHFCYFCCIWQCILGKFSQVLVFLCVQSAVYFLLSMTLFFICVSWFHFRFAWWYFSDFSPWLAFGYLHFLKKLLIFNWRIVALQYSVCFCCTSTWISHRYTHVLSLPPPSPSHPSGLSRSTGSELPASLIQQIPTGDLFYTWWCICFHTILSIRPSPTLSTDLVSVSASPLLPCQ